MTLEQGWMKKQMNFAAEKTKEWPDWMKQEAGIHQQSAPPAKQDVLNGNASSANKSSKIKS
jgi:hypothetical protein